MQEENWHSMPIREVLGKLATSEKGLTKEEAEKRLDQYGQNKLENKKKITILGVFFSQFKNVLIYVLLFADLIAFFTNEMPEFIVITVIVSVVILVGFLEEYKASKEMDALRNLSPRIARAFRDQNLVEINAEDLVIGDVISLDRGNIVPADSRIIRANNLHIDESVLTGESVAVIKQESQIRKDTSLAEQKNMLFSSSLINNGNAIAVVVRTGKDTEIGKVSKMITDIKYETTPLQQRLDKLGKQISLAVTFICIVIFAIGLFRGEQIVNILLLSIAVAVAGIPESLPTIIAVTLAVGVKRMAKKNAIIKRLPAVQTLGNCTVICTDKTGTLTQNKLVIEKLFLNDIEINVTGSGFSPDGLFMIEGKTIDPKKHRTLSKAIEIGVFCNNSNIRHKDNEWEVEGEPTEGALVVLAKKAGIEKKELHNKSPRLKEHPFDPERKCMSTVHLVEKKAIVYSKGAPELLLKKAKFYFDNGAKKKLTKEKIDSILSKNEDYASKGMRVLALAFKAHNQKKYELEHVESELIFVGLVSMRDPPQVNAKESVQMCKEAGIKVVMITGDNKITARAIATDLGIYAEGDMILQGQELDRMRDIDFLKIADYVTVYARTTPKHKLRIVDALQRKGHMVAMTGDGVNDAPALKKADIGIAMGKRGTDVAKEAAEMIIKDDDFSTIVSAVKEGRTIYANMNKYLYYSLTTNISEVILIFIAILLGMNPPLTALMILFLNLVTGDLPALALTVEEAPKNIMKQMPRNPKEGVISEYLLLKIAQTVPVVVLGTIALYMWEIVINQGTIQRAQTIAFATLIFFELFHIFNAKSWDDSVFTWKSLTNVLLNGGIIFSALFTVLVIYLPPAQQLFETVSLLPHEIALILITTSTVLVYNEILKTVINAEIREREKMVVYPTRR